MKYLKTIYLYRYDEKENTWQKRELEKALVSGSSESYNLSDTLNRDAHVTLRIMGDDAQDVMPQDIISLENTEEIPPKENFLVVVSVCKNSLGSKRVRHTKILCR